MILVSKNEVTWPVEIYFITKLQNPNFLGTMGIKFEFNQNHHAMHSDVLAKDLSNIHAKQSRDFHYLAHAAKSWSKLLSF